MQTGSDDADVRQRLASLASELLADYRARQTQRLEPQALLAWQPLCLGTKTRSGWRSGLASFLGTISALSLAGAIVLNVLNHQSVGGGCDPYGPQNTHCVASYDTLIGVGYALAGVSLAGMSLTLAVPEKAP
jgi:hypothetical protein